MTSMVSIHCGAPQLGRECGYGPVTPISSWSFVTPLTAVNLVVESRTSQRVPSRTTSSSRCFFPQVLCWWEGSCPQPKMSELYRAWNLPGKRPGGSRALVRWGLTSDRETPWPRQGMSHRLPVQVPRGFESPAFMLAPAARKKKKTKKKKRAA